LRFSGHYGWIQKQLIELKINKQIAQQKKNASRNTEEDQIVLYAAVEGDRRGFAKTEVSSIYFPKVGNYQELYKPPQPRPLVQAAHSLLEQSYKGVLLQSQINSEKLN
jgi:hypothetical protein